MSENKISGRSLRIFAAIAIIVSFTIFYKEDSHAASFTHVHTDECYQSVTKTCTDHYYVDRVGYLDLHCNNCGTTRSFVNIVYWDVCKNNLRGNIDSAYIQYCTVCGYHRRKETPGPPKSHTYVGRDVICGKDESTSIANVSLNPASGAPTNGNVTLNVSISDATSEFSLAAAPFNFGAGNTDASSFEVSENGTYSVAVTDSIGRTVSASCTVSSIDRVAPVIDSISKNTEDWSESGVVITAEAHDEGLGLAEDTFSFNGGAFGAANSYKVTSNGNVSVRVKDAAGNITESSISIGNVGRDPKVVEAERREAKRLAEEKAAAEKAAAEKEAAEKATAEKAALEKAAAEKALKNKTAKEKTSRSSATDGKDIKKSATKNPSTKDSVLSVGIAEAAKSGSALAGGALGSVTFGKESFTSESFGSGVSGKLISVKDVTKGEAIDVTEAGAEDVIESVNDLADSEDGSAVSLDEDGSGAKVQGTTILKASMGDYSVMAGVLLLLLGTFIISRFSYVYVMQGGKRHVIGRCRVIRTQKGLTVIVPKAKLTGHGKYLLYISPWKSGFKKKLPVNVMLEGEDSVIPTDEGNSFKY